MVSVSRWRRGASAARRLRVDDHGVVITTSRFTNDAVAEASAPEKAPIGLVDGPKLVDLLIEQGIGVQKKSLVASSPGNTNWTRNPRNDGAVGSPW
jgi:hypothetical protein